MDNFFNNYLQNYRHMNLETGDFPGPFITISRQAGCSAKRIAIKLSKILTGYSYMSDTKTDAEWKWVNKEVFSQVVDEMINEVIAGEYDTPNGDAVRFLRTVDKAFSDETIYDIRRQPDPDIKRNHLSSGLSGKDDHCWPICRRYSQECTQ